MVSLTDAAKKEVTRLLGEHDDLNGSVLRMGVRGGGCSGLSYTLGFDKETSEYDHIIEFDNVKVVVDMKSALYLKGTEVDYTHDLLGGGFKFNNPNARKSCGCGSSFQP